jgi:hypothetical protein
MSALPDTTVTLTLPEAVYRQAQAAARDAHRSVREVLTDVLTAAFPSVYVSPDRGRMALEELAFDRLRDELMARYEDAVTTPRSSPNGRVVLAAQTA